MRIDAHQHFWKLQRGDYHWMNEGLGVLYRDFLPQDLAGELADHSIDFTIVVQAAQTTQETDFLLELAGQNRNIAGVVGWLDLESDNFTAQLNSYSRNPKFVGLRPMLQDLADDAWVLRPSVLHSLQAIADAGLAFDFLVHTRHLPYVIEAMQKVPHLRAVIDHIAKPEIRNHTMAPWQDLIKQAADTGLYCKLSGMITEANHKHWSANDLQPYVQHVVSCFGWQRIMFGSDWPVCLLAGSYGQVIQALKDALGDSLTPEREAKLFGENAAKFYKLAV